MEQPEILKAAVEILDRQAIPYMIVGSFASISYGEPRSTLDIDIVIDASDAAVRALCSEFPPGEYYVSLPAALDAVRRRSQFKVIHPVSGNKIDFMIARNDAWGREQISRRRPREFLPDCVAWAASPEEIILSKMNYYREGQSDKHLRDITGMLKVSGDEIDQKYISDWAERLGLTEIWHAILTRLGQISPSESAS